MFSEKTRASLLSAVLFVAALWPALGHAQQAEGAQDEPVEAASSAVGAAMDRSAEVESVEAETEAVEPAPLESPRATRDEAPADAELTAEELAELEASLTEDLDEADSDTTSAPSAASGQSGGMLQSMNPDIAVILDVAAAYFSGEPMQTGAHDPSRTGFNLQQLEVHIGSNVDPFFSLDVNLVFAEFGVEVEEAYLTTLALPWNLKARGGQFLTRFGRINPTHPHSWTFLDQPLVSGKFFGGESSRGLGAELSWLTPLPWYAEVVGSTTMANNACCARSFYGADDPGVEGLEDLLYTTALKQFFDLSQSWSLLWGVSAQFGPNASGNQNRTEIYGTDFYLRWRPVDSTSRTAVSLQVEAMFRSRQVPDDVLQDLGGYAQLAWTINPEWETAARYEYVEGIEDDPLDPEWNEERQRASLQLTYYPSHFSRLRLQASRDDAAYRDDAIWALMLGVEVLVGAHGAHSY